MYRYVFVWCWCERARRGEVCLLIGGGVVAAGLQTETQQERTYYCTRTPSSCLSGIRRWVGWYVHTVHSGKVPWAVLSVCQVLLEDRVRRRKRAGRTGERKMVGNKKSQPAGIQEENKGGKAKSIE
ncbi:hypothetical protein LX36DRAFT_317093 [Colletotrichum falcatum]|nr:hypothetical protein LX36DRAFT_317093 [Colletotrichum falcatum]